MMIFCLLSILLTVVPSQGAFLTQIEPRDSILIADQLVYGFELKGIEEGTVIMLPQIKRENEGDDGVMVLTDWKIDTLKTYKPQKDRPQSYDLRAGFVVTSFEEGEYELPAISALVGNRTGGVDTLVFEPMIMKVTTIPIDTESFEIHDIKGLVRYPITFKELLPYLFGLLGLALLVYAIVRLIVFLRRKEEGEMARRDPAHIVALRKIDKYRGDKLWVPEKQKVFYSGVTDALREYIVARYGVSAMEMTTREIFDALKDSDMPADLYPGLETLFQRSDFVKFAKYVASREENAEVVPLAVRFITTTYQSDVASESRAEVESESEVGSKSEIEVKSEAGSEVGQDTWSGNKSEEE